MMGQPFATPSGCLRISARRFSRDDFLRSLDKFYKAIEAFEDKRHFLIRVKERFFQGYSVTVADTNDAADVDFMCASVEEVLK